MGNTPSKDPLNSHSSTSTTGTGGGAAEPHEADEKPVLSRKRQLALKPRAINIALPHHIVPPEALGRRVSPQRRGSRKTPPKPLNELDLEIGALMAQLLSGTPAKDVPGTYSLLVDSVALLLPVFTSLEGKDDDLLLLTLPEMYDKERERLVRAALAKDKRKKLRKDAKEIAVARTQLNSLLLLLLLRLPPLAPTPKKTDIDIDLVIERILEVANKRMPSQLAMRRGKDKLPVTLPELKYILARLRQIFLEQPTLLKLLPPVKIVGDIHGQFHDLVRIFNLCGHPPHTNYLFLGDYVDRGHKLLELILLLLCYKIKYPENFFMLRGNHELANITKIYGFYDECKRRLPPIAGNHKLWRLFVDVFNTLPIGATINDKIFCIHGGLLPDLHDLQQIENIKRPTDIPDRGLLADLLWLDPDPLIKHYLSTNWPKNDRGVLYCFGKRHVDHFCLTFKMDLIVRGHMVVEDGYEFFNKRKLVTVFSAPNYCGEFKNFGAVMLVDKILYCSFEIIKPQ